MFSLDAEVAAALAVAEEAGALAPIAPRGDAIALRNSFNMILQLLDSAEPDSPSVLTDDHLVAVAGGEILARWYARERSAPGSAVVYYHGGGRVCGSVDLYDWKSPESVEACTMR